MNGNSQNATVFRESEGASIILQLAMCTLSRKQSLYLLQQLILAGGNEEDMKALLSLLYAPKLFNCSHTSTIENENTGADSDTHKHGFNSITTFDYEARIEVLKAVIYCLRESHRSRTIFRYDFATLIFLQAYES